MVTPPNLHRPIMDEEVLRDVNKKQKLDNIKKWAEVSRKPGMFRYAFSIIGHPSMVRQRTIEDAYRLKALGFEINRASILTPFPGTGQWKSIDREFGIDETDLHKYDSRNLVWKHPYIGKSEMLELLQTLKTTYNSSIKLYREGLGRLVYDEVKRGKLWFLKNYILRSIISSNFINDTEQVYFPNLEGHKMQVAEEMNG